MTPIIQIPKWTLYEAIQLIRKHQDKFHEMNYHLALAGSVLNNGESHNDLDIICMNMNNGKSVFRDDMMNYIKGLGNITDASGEYEIENGRELYKIYLEDGRVIDFFLYDASIYDEQNEPVP